MNMVKKLFALLLICSLLVSMLPTAVYGEERSEHIEVAPTSEEQPSDPAWDRGMTTGKADSETDLQVRKDYDLSPEDSASEPKGELKAGEQSGSCGDTLQWSFLTDTGELIISGSGKMADYYSGNAPWYGLRNKIKKLTVQDGVTYLGKSAFYYCSKLTEVSLPNSLQMIGAYCFQECTLLTSISFPEGMESIGYGAFNLAGLGSVHIPSSLTDLGDFCFYGCQNLNEISVAEGNPTYCVTDGVLYDYVNGALVLCPANRTAHLVIPDSVAKLQEEGLAHCTELEGVTIPDGMTWDPNAFTFCKGLLNVYVYETNPDYQSLEGVLYSKDGRVLVLFPAGRSGSYQVKDGTVEIGYGAFCRMENEINVSLPDSVEVISGSAFSYSPGLRELKLSGKLREIYAHAFNGCTNMGNVVLPESLTLFGYGSFEDCKSITEITVPSRITSVASDTFMNCTSLKKVELKGAVTGIYNYAFYNCTALETINLPESLEEIYSYGFCYCRKLQAVELPESLTYMGSYAFNSCTSLTKVVIPQGVEQLYSSVFRGCNALKEIVLPRGLEMIGASALSDTAIEQLVIPETVKELGSGAFRWCESLKCIHFLGDAPAVVADSFSYTAEELELCYIEGKEGWSTPQWNEIPTQTWTYDYSTTASCTLGGEERFQCKHCSLDYVRKVQAYGHSFGEWILGQRPTESSEGYWSWSCTVCGAEEREAIPVLAAAEQTAMTSSNAARQNYTVYARTVRSYLVENEDGTLTRVEAGDTFVSIERYAQDLSFIDRRELPMELPIFGGFYEGETDYFLVFGQMNQQEEDSAEVIRVVRYSKDWLRKGQSSLYGANTYIPFDAGSLRMTQYGDMLYVHTCHEMYKSSDGYHHQANMIFGVYLPEMRITDQYTDVMNVSYGYVSHSFNQFILTDGNRLLTLNHGDAYPRSAVIVEYQKPAGEQEFTGSCNYTSVMGFTGSTGYNATGASLGAFELSDTAYLTAGNSIVQDGSVDFSGQRNIFLGVTPRGEIATEDSTIRWTTNYDNNAGVKISTPHLVKIREDHFLLLWMENDILRYVFVNGRGVKTSQVYQAEMLLSDCKPIVYQNQICWYVTQSSQPLFCSIPLEHPESPTMSELEVTVTLDPNGGALENPTVTLLWNKPYGELPVPYRKSAYKFLGWYTSPYSYGTQITAETRVTSPTEHTLYAKWERQDHECEMELTEVIPATCTSGEVEVYTCIYCDYGYSIYDYEYVHTWDEGKITIEPTCVKYGEKVITCVLCGVTETESVPPTGHSYTDVVTEPSCLERGYTTHICACGHEYTDSFLPALGHEWDEGRITTEPDCTTGGTRTLQCVRCTATKTETVPALGHDWNEGSIITEPTCTTGGLRSLKCHRCAASKTETVPPTGHSYMDDICTVCGEGLKNPFEDVYEQDYFFKPVLWAVQRGITNGTSATRFSPAAPCTRGQIVTFLWRACGSPEPDGEHNPFADVSTSDYYYKAVIWAVENGITTGTGATTFSPDRACTRGQVVTFLWRAQGKPTPSSEHNPFADVDSKAYYCNAVLWAVEEEITNGTGKGKFSPDASCTRGQIVTFLYRALKETKES